MQPLMLVDFLEFIEFALSTTVKPPPMAIRLLRRSASAAINLMTAHNHSGTSGIPASSLSSWGQLTGAWGERNCCASSGVANCQHPANLPCFQPGAPASMTSGCGYFFVAMTRAKNTPRPHLFSDHNTRRAGRQHTMIASFRRLTTTR